MGNLPGVTGVNDITVGGRARTGWVSTSQVRGTAAPQAAEWMARVELHVGSRPGLRRLGLGMVKLSQSFSPALSLPEPQVKVVIAMAALAGRVTRTKADAGKRGEKFTKVAVRAVNAPDP